MAVLLLPAAWVLLWLHCLSRPSEDGWRGAALSAAVAWGALLTALTEFLSAFQGLAFGWLLGAWLAACLALLLALIPRAPGLPGRLRLDPGGLPWFGWLLLGGGAALAAATGLTALGAPPNTWDSMAYHMARVDHWAHNRSVAHYPTRELRQLYLGPWSELVILHLRLLRGGDGWANFVQWSSMVGSALGVSLIAKRLGGDAGAQVFAAVLAVTLPMGVLQASGTQTDYVVSFWLVCLAYHLLRLQAAPGAPAAAAGASLGLALLTKPTAYLYAPAFLAWLAAAGLRARRGAVLATVLVVAAALNLGHWARNVDLFQSPLRPGDMGPHESVNGLLSLPAFLSNVVRNAALHLGTPSYRVNAAWERGVGVLHTFLGLDPSDPRTTAVGRRFFVPRLSTHEDYAGCPAHLALAALSAAALFLRRPGRRRLLGYGAAVAAGPLLLCLFLRWMEWNSRYHLPAFVLWAPAGAVVLSAALPGRFVRAAAAGLLLAALPWVLFNEARPVAGEGSVLHADRTGLYFRNAAALQGPFVGAAAFVRSRGCTEVGLEVDDYEHALWVLLRPVGGRVGHVECVNVDNVSARKGNRCPCRGASPAAVIAFKYLGAPGEGEGWEEIVRGGAVYSLAWSSGVFVLHGRRCAVGAFLRRQGPEG
jgi:hypothetical protein